MSSVYTIVSHSFSFIPSNLPNSVPHSIVCAVFASVSLPRTRSNTVGKSVVHSVVLPLTHELNVREPFGHSLHHAFRHTRPYSVAHCCMHSIIFHHSLCHSIILTVTPYHFCYSVCECHSKNRSGTPFYPVARSITYCIIQSVIHFVGHRLTSSIPSCTHCVMHALRIRDFRESYPRREGPWNIPRAFHPSPRYSCRHICSMFSGAHSIRHFVP